MRPRRPGYARLVVVVGGLEVAAGTGSVVSETGDLILTRIHDPVRGWGIRIDRADPRILVSGRLLDKLAISDHPHAMFDGVVLRVRGVNRTVVYRMAEYDGLTDVYTFEFPD